MRLSYVAYATLFFVSVSGAPERAFAQPATSQPSAADRDTARKLLDDGDDAFSKKDFPSALKAYSAAHAIMHVPSTGIELAKAQVASGLLVEAWNTVLEVKRMQKAPDEPEAFAAARQQAGDLAAQLDARIPSLEIKPNGPPHSVIVEVSIDGAVVPAEAATLPRRVNPGAHKVLVKAPGFADASREVTVQEGDKLAVPIDMVGTGAPPPVAPPKVPVAPPNQETKSTGGMSVLLPIGLATTGAGLVVGLGTGLAALSSKGCKAHHNCALAWASDVGFGVAVVGAALTTVGIVLTLKHPKPDASHATLHIDPVIGVGFLGAQGEY